jgi:lipopolysaccharide/colanic/teichoic acid biosynthesis glycosyltransferase
MRRIVDVMLATIAIIVLSPLMLLIMIVLRFTGEGEVFYCQQRVGQDGMLFGAWKFATMLKNSPNMGTGTVTIKNDPRILPLGRFMRKCKLDELPQLFNILKGDMSMIGPRPQTRRCFDAYPASSKEAVMSVKPGLSGVGAIVFCNEEELLLASPVADQVYDDVIMPFKGELEEWYVQNRTGGTYVKLLVLALLALLFIRRTSLVWRVFPELPLPGSPLASLLGLSSVRSTGNRGAAP